MFGRGMFALHGQKKKQHRNTVWQPELPHIRNYVHHLDGPFLASEIMSIIWTDQTHCGISDSTLIQLYMNLGTLHESRNKVEEHLQILLPMQLRHVSRLSRRLRAGSLALQE